MCSKRGLSLLFLIFSCLSFLGCNLPLNEKPPESDPIEVGLGASSACLSNVVPVFEHFFEGVARNAELETAFNCMGSAVSEFEKSTRGRYEDRFTDRELAHFVEQYFMEKGSRIPDALMLEIFRIKQLFVGGSLQSLTRTEMKDLLDVISELKRISLVLNPHMKVYTFNWNNRRSEILDSDVQEFEQANQAIQDATKDLATLIESKGYPYHLDDALVLLKELSTYSATSWRWISQVEKAMPLVQKLKQTLAGGDPGEVAPQEWRRFALLAARGYVQYLRYYYFLKGSNPAEGGKQLQYFVRSISDLFSFLGDMVEGKPGHSLKRQEVLEILQSLSAFVPNVKVSPELLLEAMKVKKLLFGGGLDDFQKQDFDRAQSKLEDFRVLAEKFLRHSSIYSLSWQHQNLPLTEAQSIFATAESSLTEIGDSLGLQIEDSYDLKDLITLAGEIDKLYSPQGLQGKPLKETASQFVPVVISFKNILFTDQSSVLGETAPSRRAVHQQWSLFLKTAAEIYSRYMYYDYFLKGQSFTEDPGLYSFHHLVVDSSTVMDQLIANKPTGLISFYELSDLIQKLEDTQFLQTQISQKTINGLIQTLAQKILLPYQDRLSGKKPTGVTATTLKTLRDEFAIWAEGQRFVNDSYRGVPAEVGKSAQSLQSELNAAGPSDAIKELKMVYDSPIPLSFDGVGRIYLSQPALNYSKTTSNQINLVRTAIRRVLHSYAGEESRIVNYSGITKDEANALMNDFIPLIQDLQLLSGNMKAFADDRFRDANLFTPVANGNNLADFRELSELTLFILSGLKIDGLMYEKLEKACDIHKAGPTKDLWSVKLDCVVSLYGQEMPQNFVSMPDYLKFQASLDSQRFQTMFVGLVKAAGAVVDSNQEIKIGDLALFPHIVQYVEGIYQVYDTDRNGELSTKESLVAFPTYKAILQQASQLSDEKQLKGLFTWLLKNGKPPESFAEKAKFLWWCGHEETWDLHANREMLAKILGFIADALSKNKGSNAPIFDLRNLPAAAQM